MAERIVQEAGAYKEQVIAEATRQTARFLKVYEEYKKAPEVTRQRMYVETVERVPGGADKIIRNSCRPGILARRASRTNDMRPLGLNLSESHNTPPTALFHP